MDLAQPRILVLRAPGINCDEETAAAVALAGGAPERIHINRIAEGTLHLKEFAGLVIPGGFSYGDHLGAGRLLAVDLVHRLGAALQEFVALGRPVLGICNGFQVLAKAGLLGLAESEPGHQDVTLATNASGQYECRWIGLSAEPATRCIFLRDLTEPFVLPVGHGEGRFLADEMTLHLLEQRGQIALRYTTVAGKPATAYPDNPNGSMRAVAGMCNERGTVFGLMPHPDRAFLPHLHPDWLRNRSRTTGDGLPIFRNLVAYARSV